MSATDRHAPSRLLAAAALIVALAAFPLGALASHKFPDVPDSNIFHDDITALADSGVTTGCGGGNFCPSAFVTREQMAAFMNRLGALAPEKTPSSMRTGSMASSPPSWHAPTRPSTSAASAVTWPR